MLYVSATKQEKRERELVIYDLSLSPPFFLVLFPPFSCLKAFFLLKALRWGNHFEILKFNKNNCVFLSPQKLWQ